MGLFDELKHDVENPYDDIQQPYIKAMRDGHWTSDEFDFQSDIHDFKTLLSEQEQGLITRDLLAVGNIEVKIKNYWRRLGETLPPLVDVGVVMADIEIIHNDAYLKLLKLLGVNHILEDIKELEPIKNREKYLQKHLHKYYKDSRKQFIYSLILFTLFVENISLFSQFYIIRWFGRFRNTLKDCNQQVKYTALEETIHAQVGTTIINRLRKEYPEYFDKDLENKIIEEAKSAFAAECSIIDWILDGFEGERLNSVILKEYVKHRFNESFKQIKMKPLFEIDKNLYRDFEWMDEEVIGNGDTDFFWQRSVNYTKKARSFSVAEIFGKDYGKKKESL